MGSLNSQFPAQLNGKISFKFKFAVNFQSFKTNQKIRKNYGKKMKHPDILKVISPSSTFLQQSTMYFISKKPVGKNYSSPRQKFVTFYRRIFYRQGKLIFKLSKFF